MMLNGGLHLMKERIDDQTEKQGKKASGVFRGSQRSVSPSLQDCMTQVAEQCMDLNQFISKMDELVNLAHVHSSSIASK